MSRAPRIPSYRLHKPSGKARIILDGRHLYLGPYGTPQSREQYARLIAERFVGGVARSADPPAADGNRYPDLSINELLVHYLEFAETYYAADGRPTGEVGNLKDAMRPLRALYGTTRAAEFGPRALKAVRQHMIDAENLCRGVINGRVDRIKRIFRWAVGEELLAPAAYEGVRALAGLRRGRSAARESEPVRPVADEFVDAVLPFLPPPVADMVRLQRLTGIRSGNLVTLRPCDVDRSGTIWVYEPARHKTVHHGRRLQILLGPQAQAVLAPYLCRDPQAYLFSPIEAAAWSREQRRLNRKPRRTPVRPSELRRLERQRRDRARRVRRRAPGECYDTNSYRRAIQRAIQKANAAGLAVPNWFPHQLRHARGTEVRKKYGIEGAQVALGHAKLTVTEVYAERDLTLARKIARKTG